MAREWQTTRVSCLLCYAAGTAIRLKGRAVPGIVLFLEEVHIEQRTKT